MITYRKKIICLKPVDSLREIRSNLDFGLFLQMKKVEIEKEGE